MRLQHSRTALVCGLSLAAGAVVTALAGPAPSRTAAAEGGAHPIGAAPAVLIRPDTQSGAGRPIAGWPARRAAQTGRVVREIGAPSAAAGVRRPAGPAAPRLPAARSAAPYAYTAAGMLSPAVAGDPELVYVPNSGETGMHGMHPSTSADRDTVTVIDPHTLRIVAHYPVGRLPQHVTPSWDLRTLWVDASGSNELVPIDPRTAKPGKPVPVDAPYNLYFTPDGRSALVMAERRNRIDVRDPHTMALRASVPVPCNGINHADFSADGSYFVATCEFSGHLLKFDTSSLRLLAETSLGRKVMPQDIRLGPDGHTFYVAALDEGALLAFDGTTLRQTARIPTGAGAHGIYPSRDGRLLYVSNREAGSVSVVDPALNKTVATWPIPGGGSPDMGGVSMDGSQLWLSGRDNDEVYVFSTTKGRLTARIKVGANPHGLAIFPQPGRYSIGHTGNYR